MKLLQLFRRTPKAPELSPLAAALITALRDPTFEWVATEHTVKCKDLPWQVWVSSGVKFCRIFQGPNNCLSLPEKQVLWDETWAAVARTIEKEAEAVRAKKVADKLNPPEEKFLGLAMSPAQPQPTVLDQYRAMLDVGALIGKP